MNTVYMFVGVPGSGKSTFYDSCFRGRSEYVAYLSTDRIIEDIAEKRGLTYNDVFKESINEAQAFVEERLHDHLYNGTDVVWDQTNLTVAGRRKKLAMIPDDWKVVAIWFPVPEAAEWKRRLNRPGKTIPLHVIENMVNTFVIPDTTEGFDEVYRFDAFKRKFSGETSETT